MLETSDRSTFWLENHAECEKILTNEILKPLFCIYLNLFKKMVTLLSDEKKNGDPNYWMRKKLMTPDQNRNPHVSK